MIYDERSETVKLLSFASYRKRREDKRPPPHYRTHAIHKFVFTRANRGRSNQETLLCQDDGLYNLQLFCFNGVYMVELNFTQLPSEC